MSEIVDEIRNFRKLSTLADSGDDSREEPNVFRADVHRKPCPEKIESVINTIGLVGVQGNGDVRQQCVELDMVRAKQDLDL